MSEILEAKYNKLIGVLQNGRALFLERFFETQTPECTVIKKGVTGDLFEPISPKEFEYRKTLAYATKWAYVSFTPKEIKETFKDLTHAAEFFLKDYHNDDDSLFIGHEPPLVKEYQDRLKTLVDESYFGFTPVTWNYLEGGRIFLPEDKYGFIKKKNPFVVLFEPELFGMAKGYEEHPENYSIKDGVVISNNLTNNKED